MNVRAGLNKLLVESPGPLQLEAAVGLAQTEPGLHLLVDTISSGKASAQLLVAAEIAELIRLRGGEALVHKAKKLTAKLPSISKEVAVRIAELSSAFSQVTTDPTRGSQLFTKHCAACHRIGNEGGLVGPQLDGIGNRGLERILEDLLDPNRNVDNAFRTTTFVKTDGQVIAGLARPKQGNVIVIVDALGKEIRIPGDEVEDSQRSNLSLMPTTLANSLPKQDLHDLVAWLLSNRQVK